jgi:hypothetical protein
LHCVFPQHSLEKYFDCEKSFVRPFSLALSLTKQTLTGVQTK